MSTKEREEAMNEYGFNTGLLHGTNEKYPQGATQVPIYQSSAFRHDSAEDLEKIFDNKKMGFSYTRINNPTVESFEKRVTMLEDGIGSVACASGMAALTNAFLNILQAGDEIVAACGLYGGTVELFDDLKPFGISVKYVKENKPEAFEAEITEKTRLVFAETIGNPKLDVTDIQAVAEVAHKHDVPLIVDNTVATPYLIQPLKLGADIVVHSSSKYINGSSDAISGILVCGKGLKWDLTDIRDLLHTGNSDHLHTSPSLETDFSGTLARVLLRRMLSLITWDWRPWDFECRDSVTMHWSLRDFYRAWVVTLK